jgi:iron complex outermembrane recepter protein
MRRGVGSNGRKRRLLAALVLGAVAPVAGAAIQVAAREDLTDLTLEQLSNVVVTSVSRREERLSEAPASIYVITAQEIRASGATTIPEALRLAPNLDVARADAVQYAITARGFNNVLANKMLVLIDGRTVYTPLFSGVFWEAQDVFLDDVERIEVISGPGATLWGANAVNGVISIITRSARDTQGALAYFGRGNRETSGGARYGGEIAGGYYRIYAKSADRTNSELETGADVRDSAQLKQAGFRADWYRGARTITVQGDAYEGTVDQLGPSREISGSNVIARYSDQLGDGMLSAQAYFDRTDRYHPRSFKETLETLDAEFQHGFRLASQNVVWGGGHRQSRDEIENSPSQAFIPPNRTLAWTNLFLQDTIALGQRVDLTLGAKAEHNPFTGTEFLPSLRTAWRVAENEFAWASLSRAVRAPSRIDRDLFIPGQPPFQLTAGDFDSEVANVAELGYRARPSGNFSWSATAFYHDFDRLRSIGLLNGAAVFANDLRGKLTGVEAWARWQAMPTLAVSGGLVSMHETISVKPGGIDLGGRASLGNDPDYWAKMRLAWTPTARHEVDVSVRRYGALPSPAVPAYTAVDAHLAWKATDALELSLVVQNLADRKHVEWGNDVVQQRSAFLRITWRP